MLVKKSESFEPFGVFGVDDLKDQQKKEKVFEFLQKNSFVVMMFGNSACPMRKHGLIQHLQTKTLCCYTGIVIITNGIKNFRRNFHASENYLDMNDILDEGMLREMFTDYYDQNKITNTVAVTGYLLKKIHLKTKAVSQFGVFSIKNLEEQKTALQAKQFIDEHGFFVLDLDHSKEILGEISTKRGYGVEGFAIITSKGSISFKDTFHRSNEYVSSKMMSFQELKDMLKENSQSVQFFEYLEKTYEKMQIKIMKKICIRTKHLHNV